MSETDRARRMLLSEALDAVRVSDGLHSRDLVPPAWLDHAVAGFDGVVRVGYAGLAWADPGTGDQSRIEDGGEAGDDGEAGDNGVSPDAAAGVPLAQWSSVGLLGLVAPFLARRELLAGEDALVAIEAAHLLTCRLAGGLLHATGELAARTGQRLLADQEVNDPDELPKTRRTRWRARTKSVTATEIAALTGLGRGKARQLVATALAPAPVRDAIDQGLAAGIASWQMVDRFWYSTSDLDHADAASIARALFATDADPGEVARSRLDPEGDIRTTPWQAGPFAKALEEAVTRARGADAKGEARERQARHDARDAYAVVDDDGSARLVITGDAASIAGSADWLHLLATRAKKIGDPRMLPQLRSDLARALLLHGTLPLTGTKAAPGTTGGQADPARGVRGDAPPFGTAGDAPTFGTAGDAATFGTPGAAATFGTAGDATSRAGADTPETTDAASEALLDHLTTPDDLERLAQVVAGAPSYHLQVLVPWDTLTGRPVLTGDGCCCGGCSCSRRTGFPPAEPCAAGPPRKREGVGRVLGRTSLFATGGALRAMALAPGTTLSRILFDPADGRCIERSLARYRPDAAMREQIIAADVTSRGYGATALARDSQLDHVQEYSAGGQTSETNLQALDTAWHAAKTAKEWAAAIDEARNITWTSYFGRIYRTRTHDYRQYLTTAAATTTSSPGDGTRSGAGASDGATTTSGGVDVATQDPAVLRPEDRRHLASLLTYAALTARQVGERLQALDDDPDSDDYYLDGGRRHPAIWLRRTHARDGRKVDGPRPGTPTPERMIQTSPETILRASHWTDPFTRPTSDTRTSPDVSASSAPDQTSEIEEAGEAEKAGDADQSDTTEPPPPF